jgi:hypothetical protein
MADSFFYGLFIFREPMKTFGDIVEMDFVDGSLLLFGLYSKYLYCYARDDNKVLNTSWACHEESPVPIRRWPQDLQQPVCPFPSMSPNKLIFLIHFPTSTIFTFRKCNILMWKPSTVFPFFLFAPFKHATLSHTQTGA